MRAVHPHGRGTCAVSSTAKAETSYCLFTRPEVDIEANDFLVVRHLGKSLELVAGYPERMSSHNNVPVRHAKDVL